MAGQFSLNACQKYSEFSQMRYWFLMNLFGLKFDTKVFHSRFNHSIYFKLPLEMAFMKFLGAFDKKTHKLTRVGQYLSVVMMREFFSGVNNVRDIARKALTPEELAKALPAKSSPG
jgi:hypothetical protein